MIILNIILLLEEEINVKYIIVILVIINLIISVTTSLRINDFINNKNEKLN